MGKFLSVPVLSMADVIDLVALSIVDTTSAENDLDIISQSFSQGDIIGPVITPTLNLRIEMAMNSAQAEAWKIFTRQFPLVALPITNMDYGAVLNYVPNGNIQSLTAMINIDLTSWGQHPELSAQIAASVQPMVDSSDQTPSVTYGVTSTNDPDNPSQDLYWVASFAVFSTGATPPAYDVIYGFCATTYPPVDK